MQNWIKIVAIAFIIGVAAACGSNKSSNQDQQLLQGSNVFLVTEVVQGSQYSYISVIENATPRWVAVSRQEIQPGEIYTYDNALEMADFHSKELDRTFDRIYFVNNITLATGTQTAHPPINHGMTGHNDKNAAAKADLNLNKTEAEMTIGNLFENRDEFSGKEIQIRGVVVKVNNDVMGKNWIHIQDGTSSNGSFDLTVTSQSRVEINSEVVCVGTVVLNKDLGAGYFYDILLEDAVVVSLN